MTCNVGKPFVNFGQFWIILACVCFGPTLRDLFGLTLRDLFGLKGDIFILFGSWD